MKKGKVLVAMSGGVDSSCAAALLIREDYECIGAHMKLWKEVSVDESINQISDIASVKDVDSLTHVAPIKISDPAKDAEEVCKKLGIPFVLVDLQDTFKENVVDYFIDKYRSGETPNPCVNCNKTIKFGALLEKAKELDCDYLATGHYVRLEKDEDGQMHMFKGDDPAKDQSYFLYVLSQEKLQNILFPLGGYTKKAVRKMAAELGLPEMEKKEESQDICFYSEKSSRPFLQRHLKAGEDYQPGHIKNREGEIIGEHKGLAFYTLGQRRGLDIGGGPALYVQEIDKENNALIVGPEDKLYRKEIRLKELNFISGDSPETKGLAGKFFQVRIRHQGKLSLAKIRKDESMANDNKDNKDNNNSSKNSNLANDDTSGGFVIEFEDSLNSPPPNAAMPGQSLVFYDGDELIGGGVMT